MKRVVKRPLKTSLLKAQKSERFPRMLKEQPQPKSRHLKMPTKPLKMKLKRKSRIKTMPWTL